MKKSSRTGIILALAMTMASSLMVWEDSTKLENPFGLKAAQASMPRPVANSITDRARSTATKHQLLLNRQRRVLISRVRQELLKAAQAEEAK